MLTREQIDTSWQEERSTFNARIAEVQTAIEEQRRAREKWDPILAEIKAGDVGPGDQPVGPGPRTARSTNREYSAS